jgi:hypothetical protein
MAAEVDLSALITRAQHNDPTYIPPDFSLWKQMTVPPGVDAVFLAQALRSSSLVETAYAMLPSKPPVNASDDGLSTQQDYLNAAPVGIDARCAWLHPGGDGSGIC